MLNQRLTVAAYGPKQLTSKLHTFQESQNVVGVELWPQDIPKRIMVCLGNDFVKMRCTNIIIEGWNFFN
jgi:hypothetical protein